VTSVPYDEPPPRGSPGRRLSTFLYRHPRARLGLLLAGPVGWLVIGYLGSLVVLLLAAFWDTDPFTSEVVRTFTFDNFQTIWTRRCTATSWRTIRMAALVKLRRAGVPDRLMARVASARTRGLLVACYAVGATREGHAWRTIL
jgi:putative spermidine/putrescine transport system permease protein